MAKTVKWSVCPICGDRFKSRTTGRGTEQVCCSKVCSNERQHNQAIDEAVKMQASIRDHLGEIGITESYSGFCARMGINGKKKFVIEAFKSMAEAGFIEKIGIRWYPAKWLPGYVEPSNDHGKGIHGQG